MTVWAAIGLLLPIVIQLFNYLVGDALAKATARDALAKLFSELEAKGQPLMTDILTAQGRSSWVPWDQIPLQANPETPKIEK